MFSSDKGDAYAMKRHTTSKKGRRPPAYSPESTIPLIAWTAVIIFFSYRTNYQINGLSQYLIIWFLGIFCILRHRHCSIQSKDRKEKAIRQLQHERDMFMRGPVMTFTWCNDKSRTMQQVSSNVQDILGYSSAELLSETVTFSSLLYTDDLDRFMAEVNRACTKQTSSFTHEPYRLVAKTGAIIWVEDHTTLVYTKDGDISHFQGYLINITKTMEIARELQESKERLELVIQGANLGTWDWNIKTGEVLFNKRWAAMLGYQLVEIEPNISSWQDRVHPDDMEKINTILTSHLNGQSHTYITEHRLRHRDGHWVWILDVGRIFNRNTKGQPLRAVGIHLDISKQKEAEQALIQAKEIAEKANQAKSSFLSNISHELRTPLNAILGYTQLYTQDKSLTRKQRDGIKTIQQSGEHLLLLINDILDLSKIEAGKIELLETEFNLSGFIHSIINIIQIRAEAKGLSFQYQPGANLPTTIRADALRLRQVLLNLLDNGIKFTNHGHCILKIQALSNQTQTLFTFSIEDSGVGIAPDMQEHIFEPFRQTGERCKHAEGSGLGLAICRKLLEQMDGTLHLTSPVNANPQQGEGGGSRFTVTLKLKTMAKEKKHSTPHKTITGFSSTDSEAKRILIVDDNKSNRTVLADTLTPLAFITSEAEDGRDIITRCQNFKPDLILMDLKMSIVDDFSATKQLKDQPELSHIPVIAITASRCTTKLNQHCLDSGFVDLITKPFSTTNLLESIARQLDLQLEYKEQHHPPAITEKIIAPPFPVLENLIVLTQAGDVQAIKTKAIEIAKMDGGKYHLFAHEIAELAEDLQLIAIEDFTLKHQGTH
jgi:PAS domain S-box-containing protein